MVERGVAILLLALKNITYKIIYAFLLSRENRPKDYYVLNPRTFLA